jgi:ABC-type dipeptide/oligopeptide/nickel transport system permease subunit
MSIEEGTAVASIQAAAGPIDIADPQEGVVIGGARRRFLRNIPAVIGSVVILVFAVTAAIGPIFTKDPNAADVSNAFVKTGHLLGTDDLGRDIFARVVAGARVSLEVAVCSTLLALFFATLLGVICGFFGGIVDDLLSRIFDVIVTFPMILLAVLIVVALGPSLPAVIVAISIAIIPRYGRQVRVLTKSCTEREYVQAVVALGYRSPRIILRHILPNIMLPVALIAAGNMGRVAVAEASLSFLGAGVQPPSASWGNMISEGEPFLQIHPGLALYPGIALCALSISFSFVGDALRDAFDLTE